MTAQGHKIPQIDAYRTHLSHGKLHKSIVNTTQSISQVRQEMFMQRESREGKPRFGVSVNPLRPTCPWPPELQLFAEDTRRLSSFKWKPSYSVSSLTAARVATREILTTQCFRNGRHAAIYTSASRTIFETRQRGIAQ